MTESNRIECDLHGEASEAFVCTHLFGDSLQGFHSAVDFDTDWPDAWCDACDERLTAVGDWTDSSEEAAGITVVCSYCYESIRQRNRLPLSDALLEDLTHGSVRRLRVLNEALFGPLEPHAPSNFQLDDDSATIYFENSTGIVASAHFDVVGSWSGKSNTWLWSWANGTVPDHLTRELWVVRDYGDRHGVERLAEPSWTACEADGWQMAAIAAHLLRGMGVYLVLGPLTPVVRLPDTASN